MHTKQKRISIGSLKSPYSVDRHATESKTAGMLQSDDAPSWVEGVLKAQGGLLVQYFAGVRLIKIVEEDHSGAQCRAWRPYAH